MRIALSCWLATAALLASCGDAPLEKIEPRADETREVETREADTQGRVSTSSKLKGTLYFTYADPLEAPRVMALDLKSKKYRVVSDGMRPAVHDGAIAYVDFCSPLSVRVAITDPDGFSAPITECVERETISEEDFRWPAISPDGTRVAVTNFQVAGETDTEDDPYGLQALIGANLYTAVQVYDLEGTLLAEFAEMGPATWTKDGRLFLAGRGGEEGYGIYEADRRLKSLKRIDDGRTKDSISAIDAHPNGDRLAFILNGQLFEMPLSTGKPKRLHQHGFPLAGLSYSPDGKQIAMISVDTLEEGFDMPGDGYPIFVYDNGNVENIMLPFATEGPLDWTR